MKLSGNRRLTRWQSSLQMAAQASETAASPRWCAMKLARGLNTVRSIPRSRIVASCWVWIVSRISSSLITSSLLAGAAPPVSYAATCRSRHAPSCGGAVV